MPPLVWAPQTVLPGRNLHDPESTARKTEHESPVSRHGFIIREPLPYSRCLDKHVSYAQDVDALVLRNEEENFSDKGGGITWVEMRPRFGPRFGTRFGIQVPTSICPSASSSLHLALFPSFSSISNASLKPLHPLPCYSRAKP